MSINRSSALYQRLLQSMALFASVQGLNVLISLVRNKVVAVFLGPAGMGVISLYNSALKLLGLVTGLGISTSGVKHVSEERSTQRMAFLASNRSVGQLRSWSLVLALFGTLLTALLSPLLSHLIFSDDAHTMAFVWLSPAVGMTTFSVGEIALLKGLGRLKLLARQSVYNSLLSALLSIPVLCVWRMDGIVPSLLIVATVQLFTVCLYSFGEQPLRGTLSRSNLFGCSMLLKLGLAFVMANGVACLVDLLIRSLMNRMGTLEEVGLFNVAYMTPLAMATVFFSSLESDFFPRLSGLKMRTPEANRLVDHQIEVSMLTISPFILLVFVLLDVLVPLLFSAKFLPCIPAMQCMLMALYLRSVKLPLAYIALSQGRSKHYVLLESIYNAVFLCLVVAGFVWKGILGAGLGVLLTALADFLLLSFYTYRWHGYTVKWRTLIQTLLQMALPMLSILCTLLIGKHLLAQLILVVLGFLLSAWQMRRTARR